MEDIVKILESIKPMGLLHEELISEIEAIHSYGFSELEAIELLKVAELRKLNASLFVEKLNIAGNVGVHGTVETVER